jgi:hypothetical protein
MENVVSGKLLQGPPWLAAGQTGATSFNQTGFEATGPAESGLGTFFATDVSPPMSTS